MKRMNFRNTSSTIHAIINSPEDLEDNLSDLQFDLMTIASMTSSLMPILIKKIIHLNSLASLNVRKKIIVKRITSALD